MNSKSKPSPIARETINAATDTKLKQSASQMWCLFRFLPVIIGNLVENELDHWTCFTMLWNIVQICTAPAIKKEGVPYLRLLIHEHHALFKELYPTASIIPKMHYLIHVPDNIIRFGPPRNLWSMRFEAKHTFFKSAISKNFKNVCKTLAERHQRTMCWNLLTSPGLTTTNFLYSGDVIAGSGENVDLNQHPLHAMLCEAAKLHEAPEVFIGNSVKRVSIHGIEFRPGCALRLKDMDEFAGRDYPVYAQLDEIIVWEDEKFLIVNILQTVSFSHKYMAYEVKHGEENTVVLFCDLPWHGVLNIVRKQGKKFIVEKNSTAVEDSL